MTLCTVFNMADLSSTFVREIEMFNRTLKIHQAMVGDVGCVVWDAAIVLVKYLEKTRSGDLKNKRVLELGGGTGIVGLCCCVAGADVVCTDLGELLPLIEMNMNVNKSYLEGKFEYQELKWGEKSHKFDNLDYLIMSDVIYYEESLRPLTNTVCCLANKNTEVLLSYEERHDGNKPWLKTQFFEILGENFLVQEIPLQHQHPIFCSDDIHIVSMRWKK